MKKFIHTFLALALLTPAARADFGESMYRGMSTILKNFTQQPAIPALFAASAAAAGYGWYILSQDKVGNSLEKDLELLLQLEHSVREGIGVSFLPDKFTEQHDQEQRRIHNENSIEECRESTDLHFCRSTDCHDHPHRRPRKHLFDKLEPAERDILEDALLTYAHRPQREIAPHPRDGAAFTDYQKHASTPETRMANARAEANRLELLRLLPRALESIHKQLTQHYKTSERSKFESMMNLGTIGAAAALLACLMTEAK